MAKKLPIEETLKNRYIDKSVTKNIYENFLEMGKGLDGHHIKSAASNPNYAARSDNITFMTEQGNKNAHHGDFDNQTRGNFTTMK